MSTQPEQPEELCPLGPGEVLSQRYSLELFIGEGTFGWVFSAIDLSRSLRRVAIKVLRPKYAAQEAMLRRLEERELALLLRVQQLQPTAHVVRALEPGVQRHADFSYLVLEFIDGPSLHEVLYRGGPLEPEQVRRLGVGLAQGLAAIHTAGGVHRDLKPANIRLRGGDAPVIVDFGTALTLWAPGELTLTGQAPMTPRYASPEQLAGRESTAASDVYAWGVILYEVLTGALPPSTGGRIRPRTRGGRLEREGHRELLAPVLRCLEYAPERRPMAGELVKALSAPSRPRPRRPRLQPLFLLLVLVPLVLGGSHVVWPPLPPPLKKPSTWQQQFEGAGLQGAMRMVRDNQGNLFLAREFKRSMSGSLTFEGGEDLFVARLEPDGTKLWSKRFEASASQHAKGLAVEPTGKLLVFGDFQGRLDFGARHALSSSGGRLFLVRLDAEKGHPVWSHQWGQGDLMEAASMAVAADGTITLLGSFSGSIDFGCPEKLTSKGMSDVFLARLSPEGKCRWNQSFGDKNFQRAETLAVDAQGNSAIWGYFEGTIDFKGNTLVNTGAQRDSYIAVFDARGNHSWSTRLHIEGSSGELPLSQELLPGFDLERLELGPGWDAGPGWALEFNSKGELFFLGDMALLYRNRTEQAFSSLSRGIYVAQFSNDGQLLWRQRLGDSSSMDSGQLAFTAQGGLLIAGEVQGTVDLGDGPFAGSGGPHGTLFVLELGEQREFLSARRFRGTAGLSVWSLEAGPEGRPDSK